MEEMTSRPAPTSCAMSLRDVWSACAELNRTEEVLEGLELPFLRAAGDAWETAASRHQFPPATARNGLPWIVWLLLGGRGAGKTRAGAEWVRDLAGGPGRPRKLTTGRIAL